jgi:hypothetical protein
VLLERHDFSLMKQIEADLFAEPLPVGQLDERVVGDEAADVIQSAI